MPDSTQRGKAGQYLRKNAPLSEKKRPLRNLCTSLGSHFFLLVCLELTLHLAAFGAPDISFCLALGFDLVFACALALIASFLPRRAHFIFNLAVTVLATVLYGSQMVYYFAFGSLYSVSQMQMGGAAITSFWRETLLTMVNNLPWLLALLIPLALLILLRKPMKWATGPSSIPWRVAMLLLALALQFGCIRCLELGGTDYFSNYHFYHSPTTTPSQATSRFGLLTAFRLDLFGTSQDIQQQGGYYIPEETEAAPLPSEQTLPQQQLPEQTISATEATEATQPTEPEYNVFSIDFDKLNELTKNEKIQAINDYCGSLKGTNKNPYTGMLSGYNLILVCAESFSTAALHPEVTPTLCKMAGEGFVFTNFYNSFPNNTIDGEYALCMGLLPDTSRDKAGNSFLASRVNYLPFCLGNVFQEAYGVQSYGYHNNTGDYYSRSASHKNLGYKMKFRGSGMSFTAKSWPSSDLEMMEQSIPDYIGQDIFSAYYMTFSGHMSYDTGSNGMAKKNYDTVAHLPYSEEAKCYLSCHVELDNAMKYLLEQLEEAGIADRTAIVLVGDHFPYGLTNEQFDELMTEPQDDFSRYKSSAIFWVGGMEEAIVVDEYCCNIDILPTILNLWGFEYDSRLLAGTDILSDSQHIAIRIDKSFYTDKVWFNTNTGEVRYLVDENTLPANYLENLIRSVETKFAISADILNEHYYNFVFQQGAEHVIRPSQETEPTEPPETAQPTQP